MAKCSGYCGVERSLICGREADGYWMGDLGILFLCSYHGMRHLESEERFSKHGVKRTKPPIRKMTPEELIMVEVMEQ
jgi:hypothetical protein